MRPGRRSSGWLEPARSRGRYDRMRAHAEHYQERTRVADQRELEWEQRMRRESPELSFAYMALAVVGLVAVVALALYLLHG